MLSKGALLWFIMHFIMRGAFRWADGAVQKKFKKSGDKIWWCEILFVDLRTIFHGGMHKINYTNEQEQLARFAKAMGHPTRIAILHFLAKRDTCYFGDIHVELPIAKATVSQHLSELKEAGLIQGTIEPPKVKYCINPENWALAKQLFAKLFDDCCPSKKKSCCS